MEKAIAVPIIPFTADAARGRHPPKFRNFTAKRVRETGAHLCQSFLHIVKTDTPEAALLVPGQGPIFRVGHRAWAKKFLGDEPVCEDPRTGRATERSGSDDREGDPRPPLHD